ncbi:HAD family phosphatase [Herbiconiux sp. VKM Ac-2851]|uniref:HAD family hydrolase n=1 Tax=Herbiconiux sp. VKM Ac-2851 TaxID=2739025 RepID=UPI0015645AF7|nr:HAD family hydrolase [Herbiconiux sp. VKM Ac-2851]NQX36929.1 haloacid dehalogenase-like hydrolase [Herbiconiux sp. VKM Ac-2851]
MSAERDPLPSWRSTPTRDAILGFVEAVTTGADAVPPAERIAVFDNDGTLWTEKPMPTQLHYIVQQWAAAARADPALADRQPYRAAATGDFAWIGGAFDKHYAGDDSELQVIIAALLETTVGMSVEDYQSAVTEFYRVAKHLTLGRAYSTTVYQPMIELLRYLEEHGFSCYIVSGGDRDFMRPISEDYYGISPERVIGSAVGLRYDAGSNEVTYAAELSFFDDGPEKPIRIWSRIGRRPILAAGNSNGDIPMLRFVQGHPRSLSLLVHHDDHADRGDLPYDKGAELALSSAAASGFTVVSVGADWGAVFPEE